jgi:hypothetical protein
MVPASAAIDGVVIPGTSVNAKGRPWESNMDEAEP